MNRRAARDAAKWLEDRHAWNWYATLTFKDPVSEAHARHVMKTWTRGIAKFAGNRHVPVVHGYELQGRGVPHFHALVALPQYEDDDGGHALDWKDAPPDYAKTLRELWVLADRRTGAINKIEPYRRRGGAAEYVVKDGNWSTDVACPRQSACRRTAGCTEAATLWGRE